MGCTAEVQEGPGSFPRPAPVAPSGGRGLEGRSGATGRTLGEQQQTSAVVERGERPRYRTSLDEPTEPADPALGSQRVAQREEAAGPRDHVRERIRRVGDELRRRDAALAQLDRKAMVAA